MKNIHLRVVGQLDMSRPQEGTVTIDRAAGLFTVRPLRSRRTYTLPLSTVAEIVAHRLIKSELEERRRVKKRRS